MIVPETEDPIELDFSLLSEFRGAHVKRVSTIGEFNQFVVTDEKLSTRFNNI